MIHTVKGCYIKNCHKLRSLKEHMLLPHSFYGTGVQGPIIWVPWSGSSKAAIKVSSGLFSHLEVWPGRLTSKLEELIFVATRLKLQFLACDQHNFLKDPCYSLLYGPLPSCWLASSSQKEHESKPLRKWKYLVTQSYLTLRPHRLLCPWNSPSKNAGVGGQALLQGIFLTQRSNPESPVLQADSLQSEPWGLPSKQLGSNISRKKNYRPISPIIWR